VARLSPGASHPQVLLRRLPHRLRAHCALKTAFSEHHEFEVRRVSYDYEPIYSLAPTSA